MTQMFVLISGIVLLLLYTTGLELLIAQSSFPGELVVPELLKLNAALLCLHLFIGSICFLASCVFSDTKYSVAFGAGIPAFMYVLEMCIRDSCNIEHRVCRLPFDNAQRQRDANIKILS